VSVEWSDLDRLLLESLQQRVPLVPRPYQQLALELGAGPEQVLNRVAALAGPGGPVREISGVFDAAALGYATTLVAAQVADERLDAAGAVAAGHPGVSHCYARAGELNLWFTLAVGPDSTVGLAGTVDLLRRLMRAERMLSLPAVRRYKLHVRFDLTGRPAAHAGGAPAPAVRAAPAEPSDRQVRAIRALQQPLAVVAEPFDGPARAEEFSAEELLVLAADLLAAGWMRRYAAALRHRAVGARANVLVAWEVPPQRADAFGAGAAGLDRVSHCYLRATGPRWPYNLYTMVHGPDEQEVSRTVAAIAAAGGDCRRASLPTRREYKKARIRLFSSEFRRWEAAVLD